MIILIGTIAGLILAFVYPIHFPPEYTEYVALAILAGVDSAMGGVVAFFNKSFNMHVFITGVISNALIASGLTFLGKQLDVDISIAAIVMFGSRIFQNFAVIRRLLLKKIQNHSKIEDKNTITD